MSKKLASVLFAAMVLLAWTATDLVAQTASSSKPNVVTKSTGHPEKQTTAVAVHTTKPKPAAKVEKVGKAPRANTSFVPGDYYWDGNDWQWDAAIGLISRGRRPYGSLATGAIAGGAIHGFPATGSERGLSLIG